VRCDTPIPPLLDLGSADPARWRLVPARTDPHAGVATVSLTADVPLDLHKLKLWLQLVANDRAHRVLRLKAIVRCADHPRPVVAHGVYGWLELGPGEGSPPDQSVAVLIGVDLDRDRLQRGWDAVRA
jgi:G3E family GTPase